MQDPSIYTHINVQPQPQFPEQEQLKCPRCDSTNTKFCYYNNYNLSQPRHFCKSCRRYWTKGGVLRNVPVGGGSRKNTKRGSSSSSSSAASSSTAHHPKRPSAAAAASSVSPPPPLVNVSGTNTETFHLKADNYQGQFGNFSSLLESSGGQFSNLLDGLPSNGTNLEMCGSGCEPGRGQGPVENVDQQLRLEGGSNNIADGFLNLQSGDGESTCWNSGNDWPDLAMYAPGSTFR